MAEQPRLAFVNFKINSYIIVEGKQNADCFFIIRQGKVQISKEVEFVEEDNVLGPGDFFGVVSTMSSHSHIETAKALTNVVLISVHRDQYSQLIQKNTAIAMKIILQFSKRMRYLDEALTKLTLKNTADNGSSHLFEVGEYYAMQSQYNQAFYAYYKYLKYCPREEHVETARERMMKIGPYVKDVQVEFNPNETNRRFFANSMIFSEGEPGEELFIIQKGSVKIVKIVDNAEVLLAVLKAGDIFGEMALLESKPRAACAIAYEDCHLLAVNRANFTNMVGSHPQLVARLTTLLAERIWFIYKQIANTQVQDPLGRIYDALLIQLEKSRIDPKIAQSYIFDFGPKELINMVGFSSAESAPIIKKLLDNNKIKVIKDRIYTLDVWEIAKQTEYFRKMQRIDRSRHAGNR
jgi:CRP-like cAMP-binding protein